MIYLSKLEFILKAFVQEFMSVIYFMIHYFIYGRLGIFFSKYSNMSIVIGIWYCREDDLIRIFFLLFNFLFQSSFRFTEKFWGRYRYFSFNSGALKCIASCYQCYHSSELWFFLLHLLKLMDLLHPLLKWNQNHNEILPHVSKWLYQKYKFWRCWIKGTFVHCWWKCK